MEKHYYSRFQILSDFAFGIDEFKSIVVYCIVVLINEFSISQNINKACRAGVNLRGWVVVGARGRGRYYVLCKHHPAIIMPNPREGEV